MESVFLFGGKKSLFLKNVSPAGTLGLIMPSAQSRKPTQHKGVW